MKILHITDIHYDRNILEWIITQEDSYDVLCMTGDFLDTSIHAAPSIEEQIDAIQRWLEKIKQPVFICSGNHDPVESNSAQSIEELFQLDDEYTQNDSLEFDTSQERIQWIQDLSSESVFVDGAVHNFSGFKFACIPYEAEDLNIYHDCDVILHHIPPSRSKVSIGQYGDFGCDKLALALKHRLINPKIVLSGHIHQPSQTTASENGIWMFNPGFGWSNKSPRHHLIEISNTADKLEMIIRNRIT